MEQTSFELTPQQKGMLASWLDETGQPVPTLMTAIAAALEELRERERLAPPSPTPKRMGEIADELFGEIPEHESSLERPRDTALKPPRKKHLWEVAADLLADVPEDVLARLPVDGAAQHDHYIYGTPKRTP